ncbi:MAG TPA: tol-pal system protein YbgF [Aliidiomarina sp.]|nr:tol-pal system protein YbgF [Aliidiomarina sp.]
MRLKSTIAILAMSAAFGLIGNVYGQESVEERVDRLERAFDARQAGQANMLQQLNLLQREVGELRGITENHANQLEQILARQRDLYQEIERRLSESRAGSANNGDVPSTSSSPSTIKNEETAYDRAIRLVLEERRYDQAIPEFQDFIANNPNSDYVGNAHYWLGQLFFVQENYKDAKTHFNKVVADYKDSTKRADCMLKLGMIEVAEGNTSAARRSFEQVRKEYPSSTEAGMAARQLEAMSN